MRLEIDSRARALLRRVPLVRVYSLVELALMALLAWQVARLIWVIVTPVDPVGRWRLPQAGMGSGAEAMLRGFDPFFRLSAAAPGAPATVVTPLQLTLFGTRLDGASGRGAAIIAGADNVQASYSVGEEVAPGVTLKQVAFDHVVLVRGGRDETLFIDQSAAAAAITRPGTAVGAAAPAGGEGAAPDAPITAARLRGEIGFIPRIDGGKVSGLVVRPQGDGMLFRKIGLKEGDIVTQIGGRPISGPADVEALQSQFAKGGNISLTVERGADVLPLVVSVAAQ